MYGGAGSATNDTEFDDIWVLSVPSFQWHRAGLNHILGRAHMACSVVGNRQMAIIGGYINGNFMDPDPDPWPLGLGIIDLSEMTFSDHFHADAPVYVSPKGVKRWYSDNGHMAHNISNDVRDLFATSTSSDKGNSVTPTPTSTKSASNNYNGGTSHTGAIAGGVVGGFVALAAVLAGAWLRIRRHRRRQKTKMIKTASQPEADSRARYETEGKQIYEKDAEQRRELL